MKKSSYLEWMAKGGNLVRVDEEKRSKLADSNKQPDAGNASDVLRDESPKEEETQSKRAS